jgi:hypothetical protein
VGRISAGDRTATSWTGGDVAVPGAPGAWPSHLTAALIYAGAAWVIVAHGASPTRDVYGISASDPSLYTWFLAWWPYVVSHHLDPLYTKLVWAPVGQNIGWTTSIPVLALLAAPLTLTVGSVVAYNVLILLAPPSAALAAYALCWRLTRAWPAAFAGGAMFGFSSFMMGHAQQHLNLSATFCLPLMLLLGIERLRGRLARAWFVLGGGVLIAVQFGISIELLATAVLTGAMAWALGLACVAEWRAALWRLLPEIVLAGLLGSLLVSPLLYAMFALPSDLRLPEGWPIWFSVDPLNFVVPTPSTLLGGHALPGISGKFPGFLWEQTGYLGIPLLLLAVLFIRGQQQGRRRFFGLLLGGLMLLSLGPQLWLGGRPTGFGLPYALITHVPLLQNAFPARLTVYLDLLCALIVALYLAQALARPRAEGRVGAVGLVLLSFLFVMPRLYPHSAMPRPAFFAPGEVTRALGAGPHLLILPWGPMGESSYWQAESGFSFTQTGGYLGFPPGRIQGDEPVFRLYFGMERPHLAEAFARYCIDTHTQYVVVTEATPDFERQMLDAIGWPHRAIDDVIVYTVPTS